MSASQSVFLDIYRKADIPLRKSQAESVFLGSFPRYVLEAMGLLLVAGLGLVLRLQLGNKSVIIPTLGAFALGAQRLLPALQQIYGSWSLFNAYSPSIEAVLDLLDQPIPSAIYAHSSASFRLKSSISLKNIYFRYDSSAPWVLSGVNTDIFKGERIGIIGSTGCGKSTLVDLIIGLLPPTSGDLCVDGVNLHDASADESLTNWRSIVAHVPQSIYLSDGTISENIAFGVPREKIDMARVVSAASQARLSNFIDSSQLGYSTLVGERGIRLSGGQRQRIGIARALYRRAQVLVLDEATSALDTDTEAAVMAEIACLSRDLTVIIIAHRLSTLMSCDRIISVQCGIIARDGPPARVLSSQ